MARYLVCMTGASGAAYGLRLLSALSSLRAAGTQVTEIHLVATPWARRVVSHEAGRPLDELLAEPALAGIVQHGSDELAAPPSSGSFRFAATVIVPCSMGTAGAVAAGLSANLVQRAASVALKEGWPLVLVPRETPLSLPGLRSLLALKEAGASILPASPGFYTRPVSIDELVDQIVARILDRLGLPDSGSPRWEDQGEE